MMTFKEWLSQHQNDQDHVGFIARAVALDAEFPGPNRLLDIERYVQGKINYEGLLPAFEAAWNQFEAKESVKDGTDN